MKSWYCLFFACFALYAQASAYVDVTSFGAIPDDNINDAPAIRNALQSNAEIYFPPGEYVIGSTIYVPSGRTLNGAGIDVTKFRLSADTVAFRVDNQTDVYFQGFTIDRPFDNSRDEMIFVYNGSQRVRIEHVKTTNQRSRAPSLSFYSTQDCAVRHCITVDNMRNIFEDGHDQVYGSGITFALCSGVIVEYNSVYETRDLTNPDNPYFNYQQSGSIQVSGCSNARVEYNYISIAGQAIDMGGTNGALVRGNIIDNCHSVGIKLVNGSSNQRVIGNYISRAGLVAIWLAPGNQDLPIVNCLVQDNVISAGGQGVGAGWWTGFGFMTDSMPSGIHFDNANSQAGRSHDDIVIGNRFYDNASMPFDAIVRAATLNAYNITLTDNLRVAGATPPPTPTPTPAPVAVPLTLRNATTEVGQTIEQAADQQARTTGKLQQNTALASDRWSFVVDLAQSTRVQSIALYGQTEYSAQESGPGGLVQVEGAETLYGDYALLGERDFGADRADNPFTGGKGKRIPLTPGMARYLRISGGPWQSTFDNNVIISEVTLNPAVVLDNTDPVHNPSIPLPNPADAPQISLWDTGNTYENDRVGWDLVDGKLQSGVTPLRRLNVTLDVAPHAHATPRITHFVLHPFESDYSLMPKTGTIRVSSSDDPTLMDQVLTTFVISQVNGIVTIPLPSESIKRYYQLQFLTNQNDSAAEDEQRLGEIEYLSPGLAVTTGVALDSFLLYE